MISRSPDRLVIDALLLHHAISVAEPAARLSHLHPTPKPAMDFHGKVFELQSIHRALETDMEFVDLALCQSNNDDPGE